MLLPIVLYISKSEGNIPSKWAKVIIPPTSLKTRSNFCDYLFQAKPSIPKEITDTIYSVINNELHLNMLLRSDSFINVINHIVVMDNEFGNYNNNYLDIYWYDVVDIYAVRLRTAFHL